MADDSDPWFSPGSSEGIGSVKRDTEISFLVDAEEYYADLRHEVEGTVAGDWIFWIGFDVGRSSGAGSPPNYVGWTPMPTAPVVPPRRPFAPRPTPDGDRSWLDLLTDASESRDVKVRALLNLHPKPRPPTIYKGFNFEVVAKINALKNGGAINDFRYLWLNGTHHQKLVIIKSRQRVVAYVGTADVQEDRIINRWCELQCKVVGSQVLGLYYVFFLRWQEHSAALLRLGSAKAHIPDPPTLGGSPGRGRLVTRIATTYGNPLRRNPLYVVGPTNQPVNEAHCIDLTHRVLPPPLPIKVGNAFFLQQDSAAVPLIADAAKQSPSYSGARANGTTGIYQIIKRAIEATKEFIYVEDQYLVCDVGMGSGSVVLQSMADLLVDKVKKSEFKKLIILCPRLASINDEMMGVAGPHRRNFIKKLVDAGGNKVVVCQYKSNQALGTPQAKDSPEGSPFYVHSKTWVFDDLCLITGSANCNRRGYSHDSELDIAVYDPDKTAIRDLRVRLWLRRLNTESVTTLLTEQDVRDPIKAANYWEDPASHGLTIESNRMGLDAFVGNWAPRGLQTAVQLAGLQTPSAQLIPQLVGMTADAFLWDVVVDPDGA